MTFNRWLSNAIRIDGKALTIKEVCSVSKKKKRVVLDAIAKDKVQKSRSRIESCLNLKKAFYGINTGFGSLVNKHIPHDKIQELQVNLIRSHAAGVGEPFSEEIVRAMLLCLSASLSRGLSGVRPIIVENLIKFLNHDITPVVPTIGSVGASGDLCPLAHACLPLLGEGLVSFRGEIHESSRVLKKIGVSPIKLEAKEGLALINGTHLMTGIGSLLCEEFEQLFQAGICSAVLTMEGHVANDSFLDERINNARNLKEGKWLSKIFRHLLKGSPIRANKPLSKKVQDPYSIRCIIPVVASAFRAYQHVKNAVENELGAVTDNPLIFPDPTDSSKTDIVSGGNFHGMPIALPLDYLTLAITHIAGISERRTYLLLSGENPMLALKPGLESGFMIVQYSQAACCNELQGLCHPASVNNIMTCAGQEDYNSWGPWSARKALRALELARYVIAAEMLCAAEAIERIRPLRSTDQIENILSIIRSSVTKLNGDRSLSLDLEKITCLIKQNAFQQCINLYRDVKDLD